MPLFFFNHTSRDDISLDEIGTEFPSLEAAYLDTCDAILDIAFEKLRAREDPADDAFEIIGEQGDVLLIIPFAEVLRPHQPEQPVAHPPESPLAASIRLMARHRTLKTELYEEFARTEAAFETVKANLTRLEAACSGYWPRTK